MKVVVCKNCGAKYQLNDTDDINAFECSICTGSLEELEGSNKTNDSQSNDSEDYDNSYTQNYESDSIIVCCQNCGLKYKLDKSDNIRDFECVSCDGSLRYLDDKLNEIYGLSPLSEIIEDSNHEVEIIDENESMGDSIFNSSPSSEAPFDEIIVEHDVEPGYDEIVVDHGVPGSVGVDEIIVEHNDEPEYTEELIEETIPTNHEVELVDGFNKVEESVSDYNHEEIVDGFNKVEKPIIGRNGVEPRTLQRKPLSPEDNDRIIKSKTAVTFNSIEEYEQYKLAVFRTYESLKEYLKKEYVVDLDKQLYESRSKVNLMNRADSGIVHPKIEHSQVSYKNHVKSRNEPQSKMYLLPLILGILMVIAGIILFILLHNWLTLVLIVLGIILIVVGIISNVNKTEKEVRTRIIREKLEQLPEEFYLFYFTKPPYAKDGLNHVIVGPTGVYTILTQKYSSKEDKNKQKSAAEIDELIAGPSDIRNYMDNRNRLELTGGYDDHQTRFQFGNEEIQFDYNSKIKHKSLTLNEDLAIFLDKNGLSGIYIEPLIGFINDDVAIINVVLTNEDLFLEELLSKIANGPRRLDSFTVIKIAKLLARYSVNCAMEN